MPRLMLMMLANPPQQVFVHPVTQGQGIGTRLMEAVESAARARAERRLMLYASLNAVAFYERNGWRTVREHQDGNARLVVMTKPLGELVTANVAAV